MHACAKEADLLKTDNFLEFTLDPFRLLPFLCKATLLPSHPALFFFECCTLSIQHCFLI